MFGSKKYPGCDVDSWKNIVDIACHIVGLRSNGTVVAVGRHRYD